MTAVPGRLQPESGDGARVGAWARRMADEAAMRVSAESRAGTYPGRKIIARLAAAALDSPLKLVVLPSNDGAGAGPTARDLAAAAASEHGATLLVSDSTDRALHQGMKSTGGPQVTNDLFSPALDHLDLRTFLGAGQVEAGQVVDYAAQIVDLTARFFGAAQILPRLAGFSAILVVYPGMTTQNDLRRCLRGAQAAGLTVSGLVLEHRQFARPGIAR